MTDALSPELASFTAGSAAARTDEITAESEDGEIMGVRHRQFALQGVQFHPESILTEHGHALLKNFLQ